VKILFNTFDLCFFVSFFIGIVACPFDPKQIIVATQYLYLNTWCYSEKRILELVNQKFIQVFVFHSTELVGSHNWFDDFIGDFCIERLSNGDDGGLNALLGSIIQLPLQGASTAAHVSQHHYALSCNWGWGWVIVFCVVFYVCLRSKLFDTDSKSTLQCCSTLNFDIINQIDLFIYILVQFRVGDQGKY